MEHKYNSELIQRVTKFLIEILTQDNREAYLRPVLMDDPDLLNSIDFSGAPNIFTLKFVDQLNEECA